MPSYLRKSQNLESQNQATPPPRPPKPADVPPPVPKKDNAATADMLERRARELDERERELNAREAREARAKQLEANQPHAAPAADPRAPNWPPFLPKKLVYQNFELDIPDALRSRVKLTYYHMFAVVILLLYNMACGLFAMFAYFKEFLGSMIVSCILVVVMTALVFFTYRRLYKASRVGSSLAYGFFLGGMIVELLFDISAAVGWQGSGFLGFESAIVLYQEDHSVVGTMCIINGCLWALSLIFDIFLFITVRNSFKKAGGLKALRKEAVDKTGNAIVGLVKEHPDEAKEAGRAIGAAAVDYARENPDVIVDAGRSAMTPDRERQPLLH